MHKWKGVIIAAVGKCWATLVSTTNNDEVHVGMYSFRRCCKYVFDIATPELRRALRGLISRLATACPSVVQVGPTLPCEQRPCVTLGMNRMSISDLWLLRLNCSRVLFALTRIESDYIRNVPETFPAKSKNTNTAL